MTSLTTTADIIKYVGLFIALTFAAIAGVCWTVGRTVPADANDVEDTPEGEELNRPDPLGEAARSSQAWRAELLSSLDEAPARHAPLGLYGRVLAAAKRIMRSPTRENPVVAVQPEVEEAPEVPEPFDPLTSPMEIEQVEPVDTWALTPSLPRPAWADQSFTSSWRTVDVAKVADPGPEYADQILAAEQARHDAAALLTDVTA